MKIILSNEEVNRLQKEMKARSLVELELRIIEVIPHKYQKVIQFRESTTGSLGIQFDDRCSMILLSVLNPKSNSSMSQLMNEWKRVKTKIMLSNPKLVKLLANVESEISKAVKGLK